MGDTLFGQVTDATGLPKEVVTDELAQLLAKHGIDKTNMTLDDLRRVLADYVQDVLVSAKEDLARKG